MSEAKHLDLQNVLWVISNEQLHVLCQQWSQLPMLAIDTEFIRTNTYYPKSALIQVNDGETNFLIDPLLIDDWSSFSVLMQDGGVQKVLHSCSEDLEVFSHLLGCLPINLLDTQVAAAFCGYGFSIGYAGIVEATLGVVLPKGETRSNWLQRPLTESQVQYAALDVEYLYKVAKILISKLEGSEKEQWVAEECLALLDNYSLSQDPSNGIQRFKSAWRLNAQSLAVLKALSYWREQVAQERDLPRNFVVKEKVLYQIAESMPAQLGQFRGIDEFSEKSTRRYGESILQLVKKVRENTGLDNSAVMPKPLSSSEKKLLKNMREQLNAIAEPLDIAPEYLARKKDFEYIVRAVSSGVDGGDIFPDGIKDWRLSLIKEKILALL